MQRLKRLTTYNTERNKTVIFFSVYLLTVSLFLSKESFAKDTIYANMIYDPGNLETFGYALEINPDADALDAMTPCMGEGVKYIEPNIKKVIDNFRSPGHNGYTHKIQMKSFGPGADITLTNVETQQTATAYFQFEGLSAGVDRDRYSTLQGTSGSCFERVVRSQTYRAINWESGFGKSSIAYDEPLDVDVFVSYSLKLNDVNIPSGTWVGEFSKNFNQKIVMGTSNSGQNTYPLTGDITAYIRLEVVPRFYIDRFPQEIDLSTVKGNDTATASSRFSIYSNHNELNVLMRCSNHSEGECGFNASLPIEVNMSMEGQRKELLHGQSTKFTELSGYIGAGIDFAVSGINSAPGGRYETDIEFQFSIPSLSVPPLKGNNDE